MIKKLYGFLIIFLILCTMPLNLYAESNSDDLSMNEILKSVLFTIFSIWNFKRN